MALRVESCNIWTKEINDGTDAINRGNNHRITLAKENVARLSEDYNLKPFCQELVSSYILSKEREDYAEGVTRLLLENLLLSSLSSIIKGYEREVGQAVTLKAKTVASRII